MPLERFELWDFGCAFSYFLTCSFSIKDGHLFTFLLIFPPFQTPNSSVLCHLWKSLNLCLNLYLMCSSSTASLSEFIQRDQEEDAFDTSAVPGGCSRSLAESYERGYFRSDMDLYVSLWHGLQSPSLRRVWISAIDAWIILLFITCFQARELATATRRLTLPTCMEIGLISVPYEARTSLKQHKSNPKSATFSRLGGVFELCCSIRQSPCQKSLQQLTCPSELQPDSWGSFRLSLCWVLTQEQWNCADWWEWMCCPTCWYPYFCSLLENLSSSLWSPKVLSMGCRGVLGLQSKFPCAWLMLYPFGLS